MRSILIIDGYNVINNWPEFLPYIKENLGAARQKFVTLMEDFSPHPWQKIIIVFDAYRVKQGEEHRERVGGVEVIYTKEGTTADHYIERAVPVLLQEQQQVIVASSDNLQQKIVMGEGGQRLSVRELADYMHSIKQQRRPYLEQLKKSRTPLDLYLKGPQRQVMERWRKQP